MNDYSNISSSSMGRMGASVAISGAGKEEPTAKSGAGDASIKATTAFRGRLTAWLTAHHPTKAAAELKQKLFAAIGHFLSSGTLANLLTRAGENMRGAKQLLARSISPAPPPGIEKWLELDAMKSSLANLKLEMGMIHEQTQNHYATAVKNLQDDRSMNAARKGYGMEAEIKAKVDSLEKDIAAMQAVLGNHKRPPAGRMLPAQTAPTPARKEEVHQPGESKPHYAVPAQAHPHPGVQARLRRYQQHGQNPNPTPAGNARPQQGAPAYFVPASMAARTGGAHPAPAAAGVRTGEAPRNPNSISQDLARLLAAGKGPSGSN